MLEQPAADDANAYLAVVSVGKSAVALGVATRDSALLFAGTSDACARAMARDAAEWNRALRGIVAHPRLAQAYAREWRRVTGHPHELRLHMCEYSLEPAALVPAYCASTRVRTARVDETRLVQDWQEAFLRQLHIPEDIPKARSRTAHRVGNGEMWLLVDGDGPLALAGHVDTSPGEARIAPVYVPPALRRKGYARALVAGVCAELFARRKSFVYLATDLANAGANALYRQVGFCAEGDQLHLEFKGQTPA
jgi:predicted GNAT family acetyltransferase